tara:strand:- start:12 stop:1718 length:1707 start_codon:yes stop_codon:yes gene_type:complete
MDLDWGGNYGAGCSVGLAGSGGACSTDSASAYVVGSPIGNTSVQQINTSFKVWSGSDGTTSFYDNSSGSETLITTWSYDGSNHYYGTLASRTLFASGVTVNVINPFNIEFNAGSNQVRLNIGAQSSGWVGSENSFTDVDMLGFNKENSGGNGLILYEYLKMSYSTTPPNTPPTITQIANQTIFEDTNMTGVNFTIGDAEDIVTDLNVTATSSNAGLVPNANLFLSAIGENMTINATPLADQFGNTTINITVMDTSNLTNSTLFNLEVLNVNDMPTITPINDKTMIEGSTISIGFNVTDIDNLFTDLSYTTSFTNPALFSNYTFSNTNATAQEYNLTAITPTFGKSFINISVSDGELSNSTLFLTTVNCNTTVRYNATFNDPPTEQELQDMCYDIDVSFNLNTDVLNYNWTDYGGTVNDSWIYVYKTTGGMNQELSYATSQNLTGTFYFNYSTTNPNDDFAVYGWGRFFNRTFVSGDTDINVFYNTYSQVATLNTFFSKSDGLIYALLILVLFATIGVASQSATLSLILSLAGLWLASKFVLDVPEEFLWIAGALVLFIIWYIAKLRVD